MATIDDLDEKLDAIDSKLDALEQKIEKARNIKADCPRCSGSGLINRYVNPPPDGDPSYVQMECPRCSGSGQVVIGFEVAL